MFFKNTFCGVCVYNLGPRIDICLTLEGAAKWVLICVCFSLCVYMYMFLCVCVYAGVHVCAHECWNQRKALGIILQGLPLLSSESSQCQLPCLATRLQDPPESASPVHQPSVYWGSGVLTQVLMLALQVFTDSSVPTLVLTFDPI